MFCSEEAVATAKFQTQWKIYLYLLDRIDHYRNEGKLEIVDALQLISNKINEEWDG